MTVHTARMAAGLALAAAAGGAYGQSFNIDFDVGIAGVWMGAPASTSGGALGQEGFWNAAAIAANLTNITGLDGSRTSVDLQVTNLASGYFVDVPAMSGDNDRLFGDGLNGVAGASMSVILLGTANGVYTVATYAPNPAGADPCNVNNAQSAEGTLSVAGGIASNGFTAGVTHCIHHVTSTTNSIQMVTWDPSVNGQAQVGGIQVRFHGGLGTRLYVDDSAAPGGDGSSWATAIKDLNDALITAEWGGRATEIWVARGTYKPVNPVNPADRTATFRLQNSLAIYGGFAGTETLLSQRDIAANPTFLSGNIGGRPNTDNVYHVVTAEGVFSSAILDGFVISGGYADGSGFNVGGGAMWINDANPRVRNCVIRDNFAFEGGAVSFFAASSLARFTNCEFRNNEAQTFGGAVYYRGASGSQVAFGNCRFLGNTAGGYGGAVYSLNGPGWIKFYNTEFSGNESVNLRGGAIYAFGSQNDTRLSNCTLWGNRAANGGGIATAGGATTIENSILWGNTDTDPATTVFEGNLVGGFATADYTDIQAMPALWAGRGPGCFAGDPLFADADGADNLAGTNDDDLRLQAGSPCIDRGDNGRISVDYADVDLDNNLGEVCAIDLAGAPRRLDDPAAADLGAGVAPIVDLGASERRACPADFNEDGFLDFFDYDDYVACFETGVCPPGKTADFNGDGFADFFDYDDFVTAFEHGC